MITLRARVCDIPLHGKPVLVVPVVVEQSDLYGEAAVTMKVHARTPADAANWVRDLIAPNVTKPTSIEAYGVRGGLTYRWIGWESMVGAGIADLYSGPRHSQLSLPI